MDSDQQKSVLIRCTSELVTHITDIKSILDVLLSKRALTTNMVEDINNEKTLSDRIRKLLNIIPRREAFSSFYFALKITEETSAVKILEKAGFPIPQVVPEINQPPVMGAYCVTSEGASSIGPRESSVDPLPSSTPNKSTQDELADAIEATLRFDGAAHDGSGVDAEPEEPKAVNDPVQVPVQERAGPQHEAKSITPDVAILCHPRVRKQAEQLVSRLKTLPCGPRSRLSVVLADDYAHAGATLIRNLDRLINEIPCILVLIEEYHFTDPQSMFHTEVAIHSSLIDNYLKNEFVLPVFMKPYDEIPKMTPSIGAMSGIAYHDENWSENVQAAFIQCIEKCLGERS